MTDTTPAPPTVANYLTFSELAYQLSGTASSDAPILQPPPGWVAVLNPVDNSSFYTAPNSQMTAVAFVNTTANEMVIAYRGSVDFPFGYDWKASDIDLAFGHRPEAFDAAEKYATYLTHKKELLLANGQTIDARKLTLYVTGHSLGGAEAEDVAATFKAGGAAFAGPGVAALLTSGVSPADAGFTDYINQLDPVGNLNSGGGGYVGNTPVVLKDPLTAIDSIALSSAFLLSESLSFITLPLTAAALFHPIASYAKALYQAGLIGSNLWANSTGSNDPAQIYVDLAVAFPGIKNVADTKDAAGNFVETGTLKSGPVTTTITETDFLAGGLSFDTVSTSDVGTTTEKVVLDKNGNQVSDHITVYGLSVSVPSSGPSAYTGRIRDAVSYPTSDDDQVEAGTDSDGDQIVYISNENTSKFLEIVGDDDGSVSVRLLDSTYGSVFNAFAQVISRYVEGSSQADISVDLSETGAVTITNNLKPGSIFEIDNQQFNSDQPVYMSYVFNGPSEELRMNNINDFYGSINGFTAGDIIDIYVYHPVNMATISFDYNVIEDGVFEFMDSRADGGDLYLDPSIIPADEPIMLGDDSNGGVYLHIASEYKINVIDGLANIVENASYLSAYGVTGINDNGAISGGESTGFIFEDGQIIATGNQSSFVAINNNNIALGNNQSWSFIYPGGNVSYEYSKTIAYVYINGNFKTLADPDAYTGGPITHPVSGIVYGGTSVYGINNNNEIVGSYAGEDGSAHGFVYQNGLYSTLDFPGDGDTKLIGINDQGDIVGTFGNAGFLYHNGSFTELGFVPTGINDADIIVGNNYNHAAVIDINGSVEVVQIVGASYTKFRGINNLGVILGEYDDKKGAHVFEMTPTTQGTSFVPPVITTSFNPAIQATSTAGAVESFAAFATDAVGAIDPVTFTEEDADGSKKVVQSGDLFAIGEHTIIASAIDSAGVENTKSFNLSVIDPIPTVTISYDSLTSNLSGEASPIYDLPIKIFDGSTQIAVTNPEQGHWASDISLSSGVIHILTATATNFEGDIGTSGAVVVAKEIAVATLIANLAVLSQSTKPVVTILDSAADITAHLDILESNISLISSVKLSQFGEPVVVSVATALKDYDVLSKLSVGFIISDTAANISANLNALLSPTYAGLSIKATDQAIRLSASDFLVVASRPDITISGGVAVVDTASDIEADFAQLKRYQNLLYSITATDGPIQTDATEFSGLSNLLTSTVAGVIVTDSAAEIVKLLDVLKFDISEINKIVLTDSAPPVLKLTQNQEVVYGAVLNKITTKYSIETVAAESVLPVVAFDPTAVINGNQATLSGTVSDNIGLADVYLYNGITNNYIGFAVVNGAGHWSLTITLSLHTYNTFLAVALDADSNYTATTSPFGLISDSTGLITSIALGSTTTSYYDSSGDMVERTITQANGDVVTDRYGEGGTLIGFTSIQNGVREEQQLVIADKPYTSQNAFYDSANALISMTRTYADGSPAFSQVTNLDGSQTVKSWTPAGAEQIATFAANGAVTEVDSFDAAGHQIGAQTQTDDGSRVTSVFDPTTKALISQTTRHPDKSVTYENLAIAGKPYTEQTATYDAAGHLLQMQRNYGDAAHTLAFSQINNPDGSSEVDQYDTSGRQTLKVLGAAAAGDDTFVFQPVFGQDVIQGFHAGAGAHHDTLQFDSALVPDFLNLRSLMSAQGHDTLITISPSDTLLLKGVAPTALVAQDFTFIPHAGHNA